MSPSSYQTGPTPRVARTSTADPSAPTEMDEETSGVYSTSGESPDAATARRFREQRATLNAIRQDFQAHSKADEQSFLSVNTTLAVQTGKIDLLGSQVNNQALKIGALDGKVDTLITLQSNQYQLQLAQTNANAGRTNAQIEADMKLALAKVNNNKQIWLKVLAAVSAVLMLVLSALVGHQVMK